MSYQKHVHLMLLITLICFIACNKYTGMYSGILHEKTKCSKNCSEEENDALRIQCYTNAIEKNPENPQLYYKRAESYRKTFKYTSAISDFTKVIELEPGNTNAYYALASTASLAYKKNYALYWLEKALEAGFDDFKQISSDPSLDNIRQMKEFKELLEKWGNELTSVM